MPRESGHIRDRRLATRRAAILDAAAECFAESGYERAGMAEIARRAGLATGSLYNYFADKREVLLAVLDQLHRAEHLKIVFGQRPPADFGDFLELYLAQRIETLWQKRHLLRAVLPQLLIDEDLRDRYRAAALRPMIADGVRTFAYYHGHDRSHAARSRADAGNAERVVRTVSALILGVLTQALIEDRPPDPDVARHLAAVVIDGVGPRTG